MPGTLEPKDNAIQHIEQLRAEARERISKQTRKFLGLIYGDVGTGKTHLLASCRAPILIHSFDPGGTDTIQAIAPKAIADGSIILDTQYEMEDSKSPTAFRNWESSITKAERADLPRTLGTYAIDSATNWSEAIMNEIMRRNGRAGGVPQLQDYNVLMITLRDYIKKISNWGCDFILTAHIDVTKDETSGKVHSDPMFVGKMKVKASLLFSEIYVALANETKDRIEYSLLTRNSGRYKARTRIGAGGKLDVYEKPDIKHILKKVGLPFADVDG